MGGKKKSKQFTKLSTSSLIYDSIHPYSRPLYLIQGRGGMETTWVHVGLPVFTAWCVLGFWLSLTLSHWLGLSHFTRAINSWHFKVLSTYRKSNVSNTGFGLKYKKGCVRYAEHKEGNKMSPTVIHTALSNFVFRSWSWSKLYMKPNPSQGKQSPITLTIF